MIEAAAREAVQEFGRDADLKLAVAPGGIGVVEEDLRYAVRELVGNAATFSKPGSPIEVRGTQGAGRYRIEITDQGPGLRRATRANRCVRPVLTGA